MIDKRKIRKKGEKIKLGELFYQISDVEGIGGNTIVYRASYEDSLNKGLFHHVLIKELFPYDSTGNIYRDTDGNIVSKKEGKKFFEQCKERFIQGNQANLELLSNKPAYVSGNVNSYEAYGTFYSILALHGGENLQTFLHRKIYLKLTDAVDIIMKILDVLEYFHKNNVLHLDISPDNIILLPKQVMLIDYNSVCPVQRNTGDIFYYSEKEGYSAPEILLRSEKEISAATDLYSVCAVFFRMLTGECVSEKDLTKEGYLKKRFRKSLPAFEGKPLTAGQKAVQIVCKGLHLLVRKRYQSLEELRCDMEELILRLEGKGISDSAVWEASVKRFKTQKLLDGQYLTRQIRTEDAECLSEEQCLKMLASGSSYLLKGFGGMGKTQFLMKLWSMSVHNFRKQIPIVVYIPLCDYQKREAENNFIKKAVLSQLDFSTETLENALYELEHVFMQAGQNGRRYVFLLDGLNKAGIHREYLLKEIEELNRYEGIGILVTDRTDSVKRYGLDDFEVAELLPLTESAIEQELVRQNFSCPSEEKLKCLLSNPMMLQLYCKTCSTEYTGNKPESINELITFYLKNLEK